MNMLAKPDQGYFCIWYGQQCQKIVLKRRSRPSGHHCTMLAPSEGLGGARNIGFWKCSGKLILIFDNFIHNIHAV